MIIKKISLPDEVCKRLKAAIKSGELKADEKIPSENELAELYGVNRLTIRMALQKLNMLGIIETRVGEGSFVRNFDFGSYIKEVSDFYLSPELLDSVCEFRKLIEVECARLAIERTTEKDLEKLGALCDRYDELLAASLPKVSLDQKEFNALVTADLEFHQEIVELSNNPLYSLAFIVAKESITQYLRSIVKKRMESSSAKGKKSPKTSESHRIIYEAIVKKDFEACKKAYIEMIDYTIDF